MRVGEKSETPLGQLPKQWKTKFVERPSHSQIAENYPRKSERTEGIDFCAPFDCLRQRQHHDRTSDAASKVIIFLSINWRAKGLRLKFLMGRQIFLLRLSTRPISPGIF